LQSGYDRDGAGDEGILNSGRARFIRDESRDTFQFSRYLRPHTGARMMRHGCKVFPMSTYRPGAGQTPIGSIPLRPSLLECDSGERSFERER
jgi:hypothetical protein